MNRSEGDGAACQGFATKEPFRRLNEDTLSALASFARRRSFRAGEMIVMPGERPASVGFVMTGILRMEKILADGRRHIVGLLVEGDMFGRVFDGPMPYGLEAATPSEVVLFRRGPFEDLVLQSPELDRVIIQEILSEIDRARDWMILLSHTRIQTRICAFLILLCTRYRHLSFVVSSSSDGMLVHVPISRQDMAHLLGTRTESISRGFHALQDKNLIRLERPDLIAILDLAALARETGEEESTDLSGLPQLLQREQAARQRQG